SQYSSPPSRAPLSPYTTLFRSVLIGATLTIAGLPVSSASAAEDSFKVGLVLPMTGPFASTGRQVENGVRTYLQQHGDEVAGRKRSEEHTSELQSRENLVCRLLL